MRLNLPVLASLLATLALAPSLAAAKSYTDNDAQVTQDCASDPEASVDGNNITLTLVGACSTISVNGNNITVRAESIKALAVMGNDNKAYVVAAGSVSVMGNGNTVRYGKGLGKAKKPKVRNLGSKNSVKKGKE
ncbi:MAG: DUF3060 domain-containing protein [Kofleriaceae bacterium]|nr:DUF3060 domain-containing protein [Kofleriaceae bacterium]MBP6836594.1 DUF3060 domain-containing protein [Kofleriaceae bacterium]MBP9207082.1 DUF3060 domain-containing protein [Kofleriaceae bacterium]